MWSVLSAVIRGSAIALGSRRKESESIVKKGADRTMNTEGGPAFKHGVKGLGATCNN